HPPTGYRSTFMSLGVFATVTMTLIDLAIAEVPLHGPSGNSNPFSYQYRLGRGERGGQCLEQVQLATSKGIHRGTIMEGEQYLVRGGGIVFGKCDRGTKRSNIDLDRHIVTIA